MVNMKNIVLGIGIIVIYGLVLWQGVEAFYPSPEFEDFCPDRTSIPGTQSQCEAEGGIWMETGAVAPVEGERTGYCDLYTKCREQYDDARDSYSKVVFVVALIVGIITIFVGYSILNIEPVGSALMGSGIWAIFWGSVVNWRNFSNIWRFLLLLLALVLVIWIAMRLNTGSKKLFGKAEK